LGDLLRDVCRDVLDLLVRELALERGHAAAAVLDLRDDRLVVLGARDARQVRTAVAAEAQGSVTGDAVVGEDRRTRRGAARRCRGGGCVAFPLVFGALALARCRGGAKRAVECEEPEVVAVGGGAERVAAGEERDVL